MGISKNIFRAAGIGIATVILAGVSAQALTISNSGNFSITAPTLNNSVGQAPTVFSSGNAANLFKFDTSLGTLTGVNIGLNSNFTYRVQASTSGPNGVVQVFAPGSADLTFGFNVGGSLITIGTRNHSVTASCVHGVTLGNFGCSAIETVSESFVTNAQLNQGFFGSFLSDSLVTPQAEWLQMITASIDNCLGSCNATVSDYSWFGSITVTYDYELAEDVPAPAAFWLLGFGLLGLGAIRCKFA
tara:strand:- start:674 stop:1405 length:732 start_codon:yes stop_codon:yes gene_type:complete